MQPEGVRGERGHAPDRFADVERVATANEAPEDAREAAERARMRHAACRRTVECACGRVAADAGKIGGEHGIGRIDLVENRFVGMKSRGCYETPGGTLIMYAHRELESLTLDRSTLHYKQKLALDWAEMVYNGLWFVPLREALDAFFEKTSETTTGEITLRLYKGNIEPVSRKSPFSLYSLNIASFTMGAEYDQKDAQGFINLIGLPIMVRAQAAAAAKHS